MKQTKLNKDVYQYSKTLYGAERYKIIIEAIKELEKQDSFDLNNIPDVCLLFESREEYHDFTKIYVDFALINEFVSSVLSELYLLVLALTVCLKSVTEDEEDRKNTIVVFIRKVNGFLDIVGYVKKLEEKYNLDLFTYLNHKDFDHKLTFMNETKERFLWIIEKGYLKEEGEELMKRIQSRAGEELKRVSTVFNLFHKLIDRCLYPSR